MTGKNVIKSSLKALFTYLKNLIEGKTRGSCSVFFGKKYADTIVIRKTI